MYFWLRQELNLCLSVPWLTFCLEHSILYISFLGLSHGLPHRSQVSALLDYFVGQTEPKILRLVCTHFLLVQFTNKSYVSK